MKAQTKYMIDVDELYNRLSESDVPYNSTLDNIIYNMPKTTVTETEDTGNCYCDEVCCETELLANDYKQRMVNEYHELKEKYTKLHRMLIKYEAGTLDFELTCPIELLEHQASVMGEYLRVLEVRAEMEGIKL